MTTDTIFKQIADAAVAQLAGLPEVQGRVFVDLDVALDPESLPAVAITPGDDSSTRVDDDTCDVRMELQIHILTQSTGALASVDPIEAAVHRRLMANPVLGDLLASSLKRVQGTRRVLRGTEGTPALRQITYECRSYVSARDMSTF